MVYCRLGRRIIWSAASPPRLPTQMSADITYIWTAEHWLSRRIALDLYSAVVVG